MPGKKKHLRPERQGLEAHIARQRIVRTLHPTQPRVPLSQRFKCHFKCNSTGLEVMVAGASEDTGLARERRRLAVPAEEVAGERDEMVLENVQANFGSQAGVRRYHHSQQLGVEGLVHDKEPLNLSTKPRVIINLKSGAGAVDLQRLPDFSEPLGHEPVFAKIKLRQHCVDSHRLSAPC